MNLPAELQPTASIDVTLPSGTVRQLPVCHPVFIGWPGKGLFDFGRKPILLYQGETYFAEIGDPTHAAKARLGWGMGQLVWQMLSGQHAEGLGLARACQHS